MLQRVASFKPIEAFAGCCGSPEGIRTSITQTIEDMGTKVQHMVWRSLVGISTVGPRDENDENDTEKHQEDILIDKMLKALSNKDLEIAARSNYGTRI